MRRKAEKIPDEWIHCPKCGVMYGFIKCRVSLKNPRRERCLSCAVIEEQEAKASRLADSQQSPRQTTTRDPAQGLLL